MLFFTTLFVVAIFALFLSGYVGVTYLIVMTGICGWWLVKCYQGLEAKDTDRWARQMFGISLVVLLVFSVMISIQAWLPFGIV